MYEFDDTIVDLSAVTAIQWGGGTCSLNITLGSATISVTPSIKESDCEGSYEEICAKRHKEIIAAWKEERGL